MLSKPSGLQSQLEDNCKSEGHPHAAQAEAKGLTEDESQKKARRRVDKFMTLQVQQISATQQQASHQLMPSSSRRILYDCISVHKSVHTSVPSETDPSEWQHRSAPLSLCSVCAPAQSHLVINHIII